MSSGLQVKSDLQLSDHLISWLIRLSSSIYHTLVLSELEDTLLFSRVRYRSSRLRIHKLTSSDDQSAV